MDTYAKRKTDLKKAIGMFQKVERSYNARMDTHIHNAYHGLYIYLTF